MKTHCKTHHRDQTEMKNFECPICPETFLRRIKLNEHLKLMHAAAIETSTTGKNIE